MTFGNARDTLRVTRHRLTFAPSDSIDRFADWSRDLGELTGTARADDFIDVAPDSWRPTVGRSFAFDFRSRPICFTTIASKAPTLAAGEAMLRDAAPGL